MSTTESDLIFSTIAERDVDLLLIEEVRCSITFRRWLLLQILPGEYETTLVSAIHSVYRSGLGSGESDIEILVETSKHRRILVLIENKIDAPFQPLQAHRYTLRAQDARLAGIADETYAVLVGPAEYIQDCPDGFDTSVSYESIIAHLTNTRDSVAGELRDRIQHRICVLDHALNRYRRGWRAEPNPATTRLWEFYFELAMREAPELGMERPGPKPAFSSFVRFERSLPADHALPRMVIKHKMSYGHVDIEISTWGRHAELARKLLTPHLFPNMSIRQANKSLAISISVPAIDLLQPPELQSEAIRLGIEAARALREWCNGHLNILKECGQAIEPAIPTP